MSLADRRAAVREAGAVQRHAIGAEPVALKDAKGTGQEWRINATVTGAAARLGDLVEGGMATSGAVRVRWWKELDGDSQPEPAEGMLLRVKRLAGRVFEIVEVTDSRDAVEWVVRAELVE